MIDFTRRLLAWHKRSGRHDLPWQRDVNSYRVWISEIMLQQTQVATVIPYYERFIQRYPGLPDLANADMDEVLHHWSGLGYYSRARNLYKTAKIIVQEYRGRFPDNIDDLSALPGIGRSTAGAILALSRNQPHAILDGNVKRVLCRYYAIKEWPGGRATGKHLWQLAEQHVSRTRPAAYTQAIMDLGAMQCTRAKPGCATCPVSSGCKARRLGLQDELPVRRPDKRIPVRQTQFIMIENTRGELLLQKRPPVGVWGGLWGFPECPAGADITGWLKNQYGFKVGSIRYQEELRHTFSHFHLDITPVSMKLVSRHGRVGDNADLYWFRPARDNRPIGMAAPVRKLMSKYFQL